MKVKGIFTVKLCLVFLFQVIFVDIVKSQNDSLPSIDKSPLDISYCPPFFPIQKAQNKINIPLVARVIYSRPAKNGRELFGKQIEYKKLWRMGANESTEIEFFKDVMINKVKIKKGKYSLFAIPDSLSCTIVINKELDNWGSFMYDEKRDLMRVLVPVEKFKQPVENFTIYFNVSGNNANMVSVWDTYSFSLPFTILKTGK